jgi:hypothetical protein
MRLLSAAGSPISDRKRRVNVSIFALVDRHQPRRTEAKISGDTTLKLGAVPPQVESEMLTDVVFGLELTAE